MHTYNISIKISSNLYCKLLLSKVNICKLISETLNTFSKNCSGTLTSMSSLTHIICKNRKINLVPFVEPNSLEKLLVLKSLKLTKKNQKSCDQNLKN